MRVGHGGGVVVKKDPCQTEFQFCQVPRMGGIKLQLLSGVRIVLAVGSLPYPDQSGFPIACLDVRQNPSRDTHFPSYGRRPLPKPKTKVLFLFEMRGLNLNLVIRDTG